MSRVTALVVACVQGWTRLYTWGLPSDVRTVRREEIASDLWESTHELTMTDGEIVLQMVTRLLFGIPDDLGWRLTQGASTMLTPRRVVAVALAAGALLTIMLWPTVEIGAPTVPAAPLQASWVRQPMPPPPPPPPPALPGRRTAPSPPLHYAQTVYSVVADGPAPQRIKEVRPVYPPIAVAYGVEGRVQIDATISASGQVVRAEAAPGGTFYFVQSALTAVNHWQFAASDPARAPARLTVHVNFVR